MKVCLAPFFVLLAFAQRSEFEYLPEHPGKVSVKIALPQSTQYRLTAAERADVAASLTQLRDLMLAQAPLRPPRGIEVRGELGALGGLIRPLSGPAGLLKEPVQAFGTLYYCFYYENKEKKPEYNAFSTWEVQITVNNPVTNGPEALNGTAEEILEEPARAGEVQGLPVYRNADGSEFITLRRTGKPLWRPVTREQYVNHWIKLIEGDIAKDGPFPHHLERLNRHKAAIARMSTEERQAQARHAWQENPYEPPLPPVGSVQGRALMRANPDWYDPALPRTAFQLVTLRFLYRGDLDPDRPAPTETGLITALRLWETLHRSDWKAISAVLAP